MPSYAPRSEPINKQNQLAKNEKDLIIAIRKNFISDKLLKLVDKYRHSQLSMLKAKIHFLKEKEFEKKQTSMKIEKINKQIIEWTNKTDEIIINDIKSKFINTKR